MNTFKMMLLILIFINLEIPFAVFAVDSATKYSTTSKSNKLSIPLHDASNTDFLQYAVKLRSLQPNLFAGAKGTLILEINENSQAKKIGLQRGDIIIAYNGKPINSSKEFRKTVKLNKTKKIIRLQLIRAGILKTLESKEKPLGIAIVDIKISLLLNRLHKEAVQAFNMADHLTAIKKWQSGMELAYETDNKHLIAQFIGDIGVVYTRLGEYQIALKYAEKALSMNKEASNKRGESDDLMKIGNIYLYTGEYQKALDYYDKCINIKKEIGEQNGAGTTLSNIGVVYSHLNQYQKALKNYEQALAIHRTIDDKQSIYRDLGNIGITYRHLGKYQKSLEYGYKTLEIARKIKDKHGISSSLINIGTVYQDLGQYQKALNYSEQALALHQQIGEKRSESVDYTNIGSLAKHLGQYQKALDAYNKALFINKKIGNKNNEGSNLNGIGSVYTFLGKYQVAAKYFNQALKIAYKIGDKGLESFALNNIAGLHLHYGNHQKALKYYKIALDTTNEIEQRSNIFSNLCVVHHYLNKYTEALNYCEKSLKINQEINSKEGMGRVLNNMGLIYNVLEEYQKAQKLLQNSISILNSLNEHTLFLSQYNLAVAKAGLNQFTDAIFYYEQAIEIIERVRAELIEKELKVSLMNRSLYVYDKFIGFLQFLSSNYPNKYFYKHKALEIFERKQGRIFLEQMGESSARRYGGVPENIPQREMELDAGLAQTRKRLTDERAKLITEQNRDLIQNLQQQEEKLLAEQEVLQTQIHIEFPNYYALQYPQSVSLSALREKVLQPDEVLLAYNVMPDKTQDKILLWIISKRHFELFELPIKPEELQNHIITIHRVLAAQGDKVLRTRGASRGRQLLHDEKLGKLVSLEIALHELYQALIPKSVRPLLKDKTLYIVPTGILYRLPFEALVTKTGDKPRYLIEDTAISYLSSASLLKIIRDARARRKSKPSYPFLAFANPIYVGKTTTDKRGLREAALDEQFQSTGLSPLPETEAEARAIAQVLNAPEQNNGIKTLQLQDDARRSRIFKLNENQNLDDYRYLLFAVHGVLTKVDKLTQPALALSYPQQDGYLTMADIFGLKLNADFIMLSACNTGSGDPAGAGEGIRGLTGAFMYAGTPAIAVTLWSVETHSAKALSTEIFRQLHAGLPTAKAIQAAKLKMLRGELRGETGQFWQHPFYWAPFVSFGDGGTTYIPYERDNPLLIAALLAEIGYYSSKLEKADWKILKTPLAMLQTDLGLTPSGKLDDATWDKLRTVRLSTKQKNKLEAVFSKGTH